MITTVVLIGTYLYSGFLLQYFFKKNLGAKYSDKITFWGTIILWATQCILKLFPMLIWGAEVFAYVNVAMILFTLLYIGVLYKKSFALRIIAFIVLYIVHAIMEMIGMTITGMLYGSYDIMNTNSGYTLVVALVSLPLITLGTVVLARIWSLTEKIEWKSLNYQWLCLILPISQYIVFWSIAERYSVQAQKISQKAFMGIIIALLADIYMFLLFYRSNRRYSAEKELERLKYQYEMEKLRYEQMKKGYEETAKIRHDFQNFILVLKQVK